MSWSHWMKSRSTWNAQLINFLSPWWAWNGLNEIPDSCSANSPILADLTFNLTYRNSIRKLQVKAPIWIDDFHMISRFKWASAEIVPQMPGITGGSSRCPVTWERSENLLVSWIFSWEHMENMETIKLGWFSGNLEGAPGFWTRISLFCRLDVFGCTSCWQQLGFARTFWRINVCEQHMHGNQLIMSIFFQISVAPPSWGCIQGVGLELPNWPRMWWTHRTKY